jgi:hypothetical protein
MHFLKTNHSTNYMQNSTIGYLPLFYRLMILSLELLNLDFDGFQRIFQT